MTSLAKIQYISDDSNGFSHLENIERALKSGCKWIQLRMKNTPEKQVKATAQEARILTMKQRATFIVNDFVSVAKEVNADGVHLGKNDLAVSEARNILEEKIIGGTANTIKDVQNLSDEGVDYIGLGPFRNTTTKKNLAPLLGMKGLEAISKQISTNMPPIYIVGGVKKTDFETICQMGFYGLAISRDITFNPEFHQIEIRT